MEKHEQIVEAIIMRQFNNQPEKIERMTIGLDNEVYSVRVSGTDYIVRLNKRDSIKGSSKYIPLFKSKGIKVPEIIAEDYSKEFTPFNYQILEKLEGDDIGKVISGLSEGQLQNIAKSIVDLIKKLISIPTNGKFGHVGFTEDGLKPGLTDVLEDRLDTIKKRNEKTGVVKKEHVEIFEKLLGEHRTYFKDKKSQFYFDDLNSKNVIICNGKFNGLIDLDTVTYGDFFESIGSIKISWYGTKYGDYYTKAIIDNLDLSQQQQEMIIVYAIFNRIYWQSEIGIKFNENTSTQIDQNRVVAGNKAIDALMGEYKLSHY